MKCYYCEEDAVFAPEKDKVRVGICENHLLDYYFEERNIDKDNSKKN
jgi:hypothetical protein